MFFKGSRYEGVETVSLLDRHGREVRYKKTRFTPAVAARFGYAVQAGDRLDVIAFDVFRDAERFWRICDANTTMWPPDLVARPGRVIAIPAAG